MASEGQPAPITTEKQPAPITKNKNKEGYNTHEEGCNTLNHSARQPANVTRKSAGLG
ncbi:MAG: hypothetical protein ACPLOU_05085 [bacterium]